MERGWLAQGLTWSEHSTLYKKPAASIIVFPYCNCDDQITSTACHPRLDLMGFPVVSFRQWWCCLSFREISCAGAGAGVGGGERGSLET